MSAYTEILSVLRQARAERDDTQAGLYALRMKQLALLRAQKRADTKEVRTDPATAEALATLRGQIADTAARLRLVIERLRQLDRLPVRLEEMQELLGRLLAELAQLRQRLAALNRALNDPATAPRQRAALEVQRRELLAQIAQVEGRTGTLGREIEDLQGLLRDVPYQRTTLEAERRTHEAGLGRLQNTLGGLAGQSGAYTDQKEELHRNRQAIAARKSLLAEREKTVETLIERLFEQRTPQQLIEEWSDDTPILLLPLRLETRFKADGANNELWVRVFPDEIAVNTHEKLLTEREKTHGIAYWKALRSAAGEVARKEAWRMLADKFGANRSAWIALQTRPLNWNSIPPPATDDALQFSELQVTKPDSWTQAPHSTVMPDRFVLMAYRDGTLVQSAVGRQLSDVLVLGPPPLEEEDQPSITRDGDNRLQYGEAFRWVIDFDLAVQRGLGFRLPLDATSATAGFDQLLVIGLKLTADAADGKQLVESLIDNHHYSTKGFSLVKQGTATNNTDDDDSGYDTQDWLYSTSYFVETGKPLFTPVPDAARATDGQRLAEYLGIDYALLQYVPNSDATDHAEAIAMNRALYSGTLGYYLHSMLNEVLSAGQMESLRGLFTQHVTGRGPLPAIRVGKQPYGVLLTSAFPKWAFPGRSRDPFLGQVHGVLLHLQQRWKTLKPRLAHISKSGDAGAQLMSVLGLQPTSADYYQRVGYSYDYLRNLEEFAWGGENMADVLRMALEQQGARLFLKQLGYDDKRDDGTAKAVPLLLQLIYRHYHTRLDNKNLIDGEPLSEERPIKPWDEARGLNYIHWLLDNATDVDRLEKQAFGAGVAKPNALLYMMLHNALLLEAQHSLHALFERHGISSDELIRSRKFMNISTQPDVSSWEVFRAPARHLIPGETSERPLLEFVQLERFVTGAELRVGQNLREAKDALALLKDLPTARLERALAEHIDTLNYRLDAWQNALFDLSLRQQRLLDTGPDQRRKGVYLGAYGYLENVRPARSKRVKLDEQTLPPQLREGKDNLYVEPANGGYVQTPSLNHATAAAILRNGYLTHATPAERDKLAVNLSSERVRRANLLVEGIRNGQSLETLLGYLFERGLHEWTTRPGSPVILNHLIPVFRRAFPLRKTRLPRSGHAGDPAETTYDYHVVNGLDLARMTGPFPEGLSDLPPLSAAQVDALRQEKSNIENSLDALRDVLTAESAYQLALGNFDRAAAVMQAVSGGELPPDIEVIRSSRGTDLAFTNRVVVQLNPDVSDNPWPGVALTRRALTEPGLNHWAGRLIGNPGTVRCTVRAVDAADVTLLDGGGTPIEGHVTLEDLGLQPIDFVSIIRNRVEATGYSELESRVRYFFARSRSLPDAIIVKIDFGETGSADTSIRSFAEVLPLADGLRRLTGSARPLHARDFATASKTVAALPDNPGNIDTAELQSRTMAVRADFDALFATLGTAAVDAAALKTESTVDALRDKLSAIANTGMVHAFPLSAQGFGDAELETLLQQASSLQTRYAALSAAWDEQLARVNHPDTKPPQKAALLTEITKSLLGEDFVLLPRFSFVNVEDVTKAHQNRGQLLKYIRETKLVPLPVEEWLHGVALVRRNMHLLQTVLMLSETFNTETPTCSPLQLPYRDNDTWLGVEFAPGTAIVHDTLALVQCLPQGFDPAGAQCGLLIDEWVEALPNKEEVTGLTFNYNQPNSAPPQALLLAVSPRQEGSWKWEHLVDTVLDTFERAKLRAVEPDMIEDLPGISTLLPSTIAEFSTGRSTLSLDYSLNLTAVQQQVASLQLANVASPEP